MRIGVLAKRAGVAASSIRFYEAKGLLPSPDRRSSGYRDYNDRSLEVLQFINRARGLGFSLAQIAAHIQSPRDDTGKTRLLSSMEAKLAEIDALLTETNTRRAALADAIAQLRDLRSSK